MEKMDPQKRHDVVERIVNSGDESANIILQICDEIEVEANGYVDFHIGKNVYCWKEEGGWLIFPEKELTEFACNLMRKNTEMQSLLVQHFSTHQQLERLARSQDD
ncbi:MAG TPA: hypothetical protein ENI36_00455 [Thermoplasmatales archaeon]|nr:hypothetical protein [Thermoplasmatales archaeon]